MKIKFIRKKDEKALVKAERNMSKYLRTGDIIVTGPAAENIGSIFRDVVVLITRRTFRGVTHSCIYLGKGYLLDIDFNPLERDSNVKMLSLKKFLKTKLNHYGSLAVYTVKPRYYTKYRRSLVVKESMDTFLNGDKKNHRHSAVESLKLFFRFLFMRHKNYKEDLKSRTSWTCSHLVAHVFKKTGTRIGKRASYTFNPCTFLFSRYFKVKNKVIIK